MSIGQILHQYSLHRLRYSLKNSLSRDDLDWMNLICFEYRRRHMEPKTSITDGKMSVVKHILANFPESLLSYLTTDELSALFVTSSAISKIVFDFFERKIQRFLVRVGVPSWQKLAAQD